MTSYQDTHYNIFKFEIVLIVLAVFEEFISHFRSYRLKIDV